MVSKKQRETGDDVKTHQNISQLLFIVGNDYIKGVTMRAIFSNPAG